MSREVRDAHVTGPLQRLHCGCAGDAQQWRPGCARKRGCRRTAIRPAVHNPVRGSTGTTSVGGLQPEAARQEMAPAESGPTTIIHHTPASGQAQRARGSLHNQQTQKSKQTANSNRAPKAGWARTWLGLTLATCSSLNEYQVSSPPA